MIKMKNTKLIHATQEISFTLIIAGSIFLGIAILILHLIVLNIIKCKKNI